MMEMKTELKTDLLQEVGKRKEETVRRVDDVPRTYQPSNRPRQPPKVKFEWTEDGKPICQKCHRPGHIARQCQTGKPYNPPWEEKKKPQSEKLKWEPRKSFQDDKKRLEGRREPAKEEKIRQVD